MVSGGSDPGQVGTVTELLKNRKYDVLANPPQFEAEEAGVGFGVRDIEADVGVVRPQPVELSVCR
ncbi:hypothetical protein GCM10015535_20160 [Streptomyces gelaticus]|uniref:Uncharacterized protein n=1 Tax=Streptomyces gelaticus TaxID=285446 RepID=A0ABQ2VW88_9ACTN|nr:hypothetical protein [Streptomyces gelaticus]GGV81031.1 hypothetical protein GCM10015535_20160 [Streptomyces gelaticus]